MGFRPRIGDEMRLFEFNHRLKHYLQNHPHIPYDTGNLKANAFSVRNTMGNSVSLIAGDARQVPYFIHLEKSFRHYLSGKMVTKHKGWLARTTREFAHELAQELGGTITIE